MELRRSKEKLTIIWKVQSKKDKRFNLSGRVKGSYETNKLLDRAVRRLERLFKMKAPKDVQLTAWEI